MTEKELINYEDDKTIATLRATVASGLSDEEFLLFVHHCKGTGLNPFKKEVWATKGQGYTNKRGEWVEGKLQIMTGINGFVEIANNNPMFDGYQTGFLDKAGNYRTLAYPTNDFIGAWCKVYRKDRKMPAEAVAMLSEYDQSLDNNYSQRGIWRIKKRIMIEKCAMSLALRKAFPQQLNGIYTQEEMPGEYSIPTQQEGTEREVIDISPYPIEEPEKPVFQYDLSSIADDEELRIQIEEYIAAKGGSFNSETGLYELDKDWPKLKRFKIEQEQPALPEPVPAIKLEEVKKVEVADRIKSLKKKIA